MVRGKKKGLQGIGSKLTERDGVISHQLISAH